MKKSLKIIAIGVILLLIFLSTTNPASLPTILLVVPFLAFFVLLTLFVAVVLSWNKGVLQAKSLRMGALAASLPVLLLVLQSMGQLTIRDVLMLVALFAVIYFYIARFRASASPPR